MLNPIGEKRWVQLIFGFVAMLMISNFQYAFALFQPEIQKQFAVPLPLVAAIFSIYIFCGTWPVPVAGYLIDRFGARPLMMTGSLVVLLGWVLGGYASNSVFELYLHYGVMAGTGVGIIYICIIGNTVKWFPDRRGLAAGVVESGFAWGAALTAVPLSLSISMYGWRASMMAWGILQGLIIFMTAFVIQNPSPSWRPELDVSKQVMIKATQASFNYPWYRTLHVPEFWLLYSMFIMVGVGGLMATANMSAIAKWLDVDKAVIFGIGIVPLTIATSSMANGASRVLWGAVSDRFGRENAMGLAFVLQGLLSFAVLAIAGEPLLFALLFPLIFLSWGEIFALFSATTTDVFGPKNATTNYGMMYTAKSFSSILGGYGAAMLSAYFVGSFAIPYILVAVLDIVAAILAVTFLKRRIGRRAAIKAGP